MCHFISLVIAGPKPRIVDQILKSHDRQATPAETPAMQSILRAGEQHYWTTGPSHICDCGTALIRREASKDQSPDATSAKLRKKGWSDAKIERWLEDRKKADESKPASPGKDSIALWMNIINQLCSLPETRTAGLLVHFYAGNREEETFVARRLDIKQHQLSRHLSELEEDLLLAVSR